MLKKGSGITKPVYTFTIKKDGVEKITPKNLVILEGLFALHEKFLDIIDCKVFLDCPEKIRLSRRLKRDVEERGYTKEHTLKRWNETVNPMYLKYVLPSKEFADIIIKN